LLAAFVVARVQASTITVSASQPTGNIEISQLMADPGDVFTRYEQVVRRSATVSNNYRELGQTFTVTSGFTLDKISVLSLQPSGTPEAPYGYLNNNLPLYMDVFPVDNTSDFIGASLAGYPDAGTSGAFNYNTEYWMTFDVANSALSPGTYAFRIGFSGVNGANSLGDRSTGEGGIAVWRSTSNSPDPSIDPYPDGAMFRRFPVTETYNQPATDLVFIIQGAAIPEPSAFALAGFGVVGLIAGYQRRRGRRKSS
jgi:hypothetical protein